MTDFFTKLFIMAPPIIIAITCHEAAHGLIAYLRGDDTAYRLGRVSFNPIKHIDPLGTILIPGLLLLTQAPFLFGYAKPVPVNFNRLKNPRIDTILVAGAGPFTNILLAIISAIVLKNYMVESSVSSSVIEAFKISLYINIVLAIFNMLPLLPLDGGRIIVALLPQNAAKQIAGLEKWGMAILVGGLMILPLILGSLGIHFSPFSWIIETPVQKTLEIINTITQ